MVSVSELSFLFQSTFNGSTSMFAHCKSGFHKIYVDDNLLAEILESQDSCSCDTICPLLMIQDLMPLDSI